jgi:hypothetical protein
MTYARGNQGQLRVAAESALGVTTGNYWNTRPDGLPNFPAVKELIANHLAGHAHALKREKPESINKHRESAFSADFRIRRTALAAGKPDIMRFLESAGWLVQASTGATTLTGTPTVSGLIQAANVTGVGQYILVERSTGVYVPVLVSDLDTLTVTPHVQLSAAPATNAVVQLMHTATPTTATTYQVPTDKSLSFKLNTYGKWGVDSQDLALDMRGCALASISEIVFNRNSNPYPILSCSFHGTPDDAITADVMVDDVFLDSDRFAITNDDLEFSLGTANNDGGISLVSKAIVEARLNLGISTKPIYANGAGTVGGIVGYMAMQEAPTLKITAQYQGDATFCKAFFTRLIGTNTSVCAQLLQPTRNLAVPAYAFTLPNAHIMEAAEPTFDVSGDIIQVTTTLVGSTSDISDAGDDITAVGSSPIFFGMSGVAAS